MIRKIDGVAVTDSTDVTSRIGNTAPGTTIKVEVWRDGKPVGADGHRRHARRRQGREGGDDARNQGQARRRGASADADEQKAGGKTGLVVEKSGGAAAKAGVQPGDVDRRRRFQRASPRVDELRSHVDKAGKTVALLIERQGRQIYVPVKIS